MASCCSDSEIEKLLKLDDEEFNKFITIPDGDISEIGDEVDTNDLDELEDIVCELKNVRNEEPLQNIEEEHTTGYLTLDDPDPVIEEVASTSKQMVVRQKKKDWTFRKAVFHPNDISWKGFLPPPPEEEMTPLQYFKTFITDNIIDLISEQSNIYAMQKDGVEFGTNHDEIEQFISILLQMGIVKMPNIKLYWSNECRYNPITNLMGRNRFSQILKYFHLSDNTKMKPVTDSTRDKLFKVRPLLDTVRLALNNIPPEEENSIDEQIIPFKGRSGIKQYVKNKPHKWGYKVFTRCGSSGIMYDFQIYTGKDTCKDYELGFSGNIVLALTENIPVNNNFKIYTDNWFSSLTLAVALKQKGHLFLGTIRNDRMGKCPLKSEKELKKLGRGSMDYFIEAKNDLFLLRWFDKKGINFISTYAGIEPTDFCSRWSQVEKKHIQVPRPFAVQEYNKFMGGVDLCDMLLELYRINLRSLKWYMRIIYWCLNVSVVNSWLLYRRHRRQRGQKLDLTLVQWQAQIASGLALAGKTPIAKKRGRPSTSDESFNIEPKRIQKKVTVIPVDDIRLDKIGHLPEMVEKQNRCRVCSVGFTKVKCQKCKVHLCLTVNKNCFSTFHKK